MSKMRINELARQLEVKSREVIEKLAEFGVSEKLTHSSSIDDDMAIRLRRFYGGEGAGPGEGDGSALRSRAVGYTPQSQAEDPERVAVQERGAPGTGGSADTSGRA